MPISTERLPRSLVALTIEVEEDRLETSMGKAARRVAEQVKIPGFRPGKAPRAIVERTVGRPALIQEALDLLLPDLYSEAIESEAIDAIGQPEFELQSMEPLVVHARVPVRPTVELKDHELLRVPRVSVDMKPEQVEEAITDLRRRFATLEPADRSVQWGDTVRADVTVSIEGQEAPPHVEEDAEFRVEEDSVVSLPGFLDELIGLERGGPYDIEFTLPEDFDAPDLAGKKATYEVKLHEVKQEVLPDLDDEFVKSLDEEEIETVDQLRERVEQSVREHAEAEALAAYEDEVLDLLLATAEIDYPEVLVEHEIDRMVDQQSNHASHTREELDVWLERIGKTEEEVRDELREAADLNVRRGLTLAEFVDREQVEVTESQVDSEVETLVEQMLGGMDDEQQAASIRNVFESDQSRASVRERLMTRSAVDRLVEICSQPEEEEEGPRRSRRRRSSRSTGDAESDAQSGADNAEAEAEAAEVDVANGEDGDDGEDETAAE